MKHPQDALALLNTIKIANSTDSGDIMHVLRSKAFEAPLGSILFDDKGYVIGYGSTVYQVDAVLFERIFDIQF